MKSIPVIIPYFRAPAALKKCLEHIHTQSYPSTEVFVRDNSVDNILFTAAVNEGLRQFAFRDDIEFVLVLNQDAYLQEKTIAHLITTMRMHPKCGIACPVQLATDMEQVYWGGSYDAFPWGVHRCDPLATYLDDAETYWANGAAMLLRTEMIREIGLLDQNMKFICSDADYAFTARSRGWKVMVSAKARVEHEGGASSDSSDPMIEKIKIADSRYFASKWLSGDIFRSLAFEGKRLPPAAVNQHRYKLAQLAKTMQQHEPEHVSFHPSFVDGPSLQIRTANAEKQYQVRFIDQDTQELVLQTEACGNQTIRADRKYFSNWCIEVYHHDLLVYEHKYNPAGKRVWIEIQSHALGDTLAWFPYVEEFQKKWGCTVIVSTSHNDIFEEQYPGLHFVKPPCSVDNLYALYRISIFHEEDGASLDKSMQPLDFRDYPLQQLAAAILGLEYREIKPRLKLKPGIQKKRKIGFAMHGSAQTKYWNHRGGWQILADWVAEQGYEFVLLSREQDGYMGNSHPHGIRQLAAGPLQDVIEELQSCTAFVGVGSGLSWLSWSCHVPVVLISGFSKSYTEHQDNTIRLNAPDHVCNGCFNTHQFDAGDWNWCPQHQGTARQFECSQSIYPEQVIAALNSLLHPEKIMRHQKTIQILEAA